MAWSRWWLGFDRVRQAALLDRLAGGERNWLGLWILLAVAGSQVLALLIVWLIRRHDSRHRCGTTTEERALVAFLAAMAKLGLNPGGGETLEEFCWRAGRRRPSLKANLMEFCSTYQSMRYGHQLLLHRRDVRDSSRLRLKQNLWRSVAAIRRAAGRK